MANETNGKKKSGKSVKKSANIAEKSENTCENGKNSKFDKKQEAFIDAVVSGSLLYEAYIIAYGTNGECLRTLKNKACKVSTPEIREEIKRRKAENAHIVQEAAEFEAEMLESAIQSGTREITKESLLEDCNYVMAQVKPCMFKNINGVQFADRHAIGKYLEAISVAAKIIGADDDAKADRDIHVHLSGEIEELSK